MNPITHELWHERYDGRLDHEKLLGVYSTKDKAEQALASLRDKSGFSDHPEGFEIRPGKADGTAWTYGGFVTVYPGEELDESPLVPYPELTEERCRIPSIEPMPPTYWVLWMRFIDKLGDPHQLCVGTYISRENAEKGMALVRDQPGFRDHPDGFVIEEGTIDQTNMPNGFVTIRDSDGREYDEPVGDSAVTH